jgi:hypothetical protein
MKTTQLLTALATLIVALVAASNAWAAGEAKNQSPFNRGVANTGVAAIDKTLKQISNFANVTGGRGQHAGLDKSAFAKSVTPATSGEAKGDLPFSRPARAAAPAPDWFERYAAAHPYGNGVQVATNRRAESKNDAPAGSFHWRDAVIGAFLATFLLCAAAVGAAHLRPRRPVGA